MDAKTFYFQGYEIKIDDNSGVDFIIGDYRALKFYYGGEDTPDGPGRGEVSSLDGRTIARWRKPGATEYCIDDIFSYEPLSITNHP